MGCSEACNSVVMTLGLTGELFILLSVVLLAMADTVEEDIKTEIIKHLGMRNTPDTRHVSSIICDIPDTVICGQGARHQ